VGELMRFRARYDPNVLDDSQCVRVFEYVCVCVCAQKQMNTLHLPRIYILFAQAFEGGSL
jgi:hypothetical protein